MTDEDVLDELSQLLHDRGHLSRHAPAVNAVPAVSHRHDVGVGDARIKEER